jgi:CBS domain-containing protein
MRKRKRIKDLKIEEVMTRNVITVGKDTRVKELKELFDKYNFNAFPVVENQELVGIVTKLDFLKIFSTGLRFSFTGYWKLLAEKVEDVMGLAVITVQPKDDLKKAVEYMVEFKLRSLPVVDGKRLVGIVSREDIMKHLLVEENT